LVVFLRAVFLLVAFLRVVFFLLLRTAMNSPPSA
jgi:hypothetical protein